jgi:hypothetical protein
VYLIAGITELLDGCVKILKRLIKLADYATKWEQA